MISSQKLHIDELVQKTRSLELTVKRLQDQLSNSRAEWQTERKEWADGCDSLMACHRIAHLRTNVLLAQERVALAHERELTRRDRVALIQRDYNLILFNAREKELELEAEQLKEAVRSAEDGNMALVVELRESLAEGVRELKEKTTLLGDAEKAREEVPFNVASIVYAHVASSQIYIIQKQASRAHNEHAALQAQLSTARTNVERLTLRLEDAQTALAEKERLNNELQQEKATLKVQVGKWKSLDDRGGAEVEELHVQRAALESQIKHLESRVIEEQNKALAHEKAIQKEHKKIEKLQRALEEQAHIAEESKTAAEAKRRDEVEDTKVNKKVQKLTTALEEQAEKTAKAEEEAALLFEQSQHYKDELDKALRQIEKLRANSQSVVSTSRSPAASGNLTKAGTSGKDPTPPDEKKPAEKKLDKGSDVRKSRSLTSDKKGKRKAPEDDGTVTMESTSDDKVPKSTKSKAERKQTKTSDTQSPVVDVDAEDVVMPKKKKVKKLNMNIFASAKPDSLDWANQFNSGVGGLNIPTELSPVKVPPRSLAGRHASGSIRKS
ncbi:hypothetical protein BGW80DRAFT_1252571 [Lactifluus volemus]|nr:hypothetical protein BGW80DRAFT_1252571 [Lactifluus volemus]